VVWGRAVTNVLQNIRTFDRERFDHWYKPRQDEMRKNANFRYLVDLRNQVLKEGVLGGISTSVYIGHFSTDQLGELGPSPTGATGFFIGDQLGGSGWTVKLSDGTEERFYTDIPTSWEVSIQTNFVDVTKQLGLPAPNVPIDRLIADYVEYLGQLVADARAEFG